LELLETRYAALSSNAQQLAEHLLTLSQIKRVNYNGLPDNPFHEIAKRQFNNTYGAMITIDLADEQSCYRFIDRLKLIRRATNLFDNKTLAIHPASTIFGSFTDDQRRSMDVLPTTIRLSIGLEAVEDIFDDIKQALQ
jgi:O-acetylhomoserine (thiol)-lyase